MSTIHKALTKAQREKDSHIKVYEGVTGSRLKIRRRSPGTVWWACALAVLCIAALGWYAWIHPKDQQKGPAEKKQNLATPAVAPAESQPGAEQNQVEPIRKDIQKSQPRKDANQWYERAQIFQKRKRLAEAKQWYGKALEADPGHVDALNNLGVILMAEKDYEGARKNFEKAVRISPKAVDPRYNLACVYALKGDAINSLSNLKQAAALDPEVKKWAKADLDLSSLKGNPEFEALINTTP